MAKIINMPRLGLTMEEGVIAKWVKTVGDTVEKGDILAEIESDKSVVPFESPESGTILKLLAEELDTVEIYKPIAVIGGPENQLRIWTFPAAIQAAEQRLRNLRAKKKTQIQKKQIPKDACLQKEKRFLPPLRPDGWQKKTALRLLMYPFAKEK